MDIVLQFFDTPGHGYLKVSRSLVAKLRYRPTVFSYKTKTDWYLEEDVDAPRVMRKLQDIGHVVSVTVINEYHEKYAEIIEVIGE